LSLGNKVIPIWNTKHYYLRVGEGIVYKTSGSNFMSAFLHFQSVISMVAVKGYDQENGKLFFCVFSDDISLMILHIMLDDDVTFCEETRQYENHNAVFTTNFKKLIKVARLFDLVVQRCISYYYYKME
jgi:hypothetical protein